MICTPVMVRDPEEAKRLARRAVSQGATAVEFRGDRLTDFPLTDLAASVPVPAIFTLRPRRLGGEYGGGEEERLRILVEASSAGFAWVDVEHEADADPAAFSCPVLLSHHDFEGCPTSLSGLARLMADRGPRAIKMAVTPRTAEEVVAILALQGSPPCDATIFGMGRMGYATRILGLGANLFTYAALDDQRATAAGQPTVASLLSTYRGRSVGPLYGVAGNPALQSAGPALHNALLGRRNLPGLYVPFEVDRLDPLVRNAGRLSLRGLSVTMPFKARALSLATEVLETDRRIGAVNTLVFERDGAVRAANTDGPAVVDCLRAAGGHLAGMAALVIGAGGAARAAAFHLASAGCAVTIANRSEGAGRSLAADCGGRFEPLSSADLGGFAAVVQATPVGMAPDRDAQVLPGAAVRPGTVVLDMVYRPRRTRFLAEAEKAGARCVEGLRMFAHQAAAQFQHWTGTAVDPAEALALLAGEEEGP